MGPGRTSRSWYFHSPDLCWRLVNCTIVSWTGPDLLQEELYLQRVAELDQITEFRDGQRTYHEDLRKQRLEEFMAGFSVITYKLKEMYQMITLGGDAELELVDSLDPFSEGIVFRWEQYFSWHPVWLSGYETFNAQLSMKFRLPIKTKMLKRKIVLALKIRFCINPANKC